MIQNPVYIGKLRWTPTGRTRRDYHNPDTLTVDAQHDPLISQDLWDAAQEKAAHLKATHTHHSRVSTEKKHWLCGLLRCQTCGATMIVANYGKQIPYFQCGD